MPKILIIDSDDKTAALFLSAFQKTGVEAERALTGKAARDLVRRDNPDLVVCKSKLSDMEGVEFLKLCRAEFPDLPVIICAAEPHANTAIEAMKCGAYDFLMLPVEEEKLQSLMRRTTRGREVSKRRIEKQEYQDGDENVIIGRCPEMLEIYKVVGQVAATNATVLIQGPSGTGKELIARAIYRNSDRREQPFLAVNCAALTETLLESELFGHEKGAFTGAMALRQGKFEQCNGGTIFLDEIGDMSLSTQSKILRVLQEQTFERVGGAETIKVDVRVIAATNKSLVECVRNHGFRVDLFYRLKVVSIFMPPLMERGDDIKLLCDHFIAKYSREAHKQIDGISQDAMDSILQHNWPGNVRELENAIESAIVLCQGRYIMPEHLSLAQETSQAPATRSAPEVSHDDYESFFRHAFAPGFAQAMSTHQGNLFGYLVGGAEKALINLAMERLDKNQVQVAKALGISRNTLRAKLKAYGID